MQWVNAFKTAIEYADEPIRYQRSLMEARKLARQEEKEREDEENEKNADSLDQTKIQLEEEKRVKICFFKNLLKTDLTNDHAILR